MMVKVISLEERKASVKVSRDTLSFHRAVEKQNGRDIGKELQKGYMKLLSAYGN